MRKLVCLITILILTPVVCFAAVKGPIFDGGVYESYHISADHEWNTESGVNVFLYYEHFSQRRANNPLFYSHFDGEKYFFCIIGLGQVGAKNFKMQIQYQIDDKIGIISLSNDYSKALDKANAITYFKESDQLILRGYTFDREFQEIKSIMKPSSLVRFYVLYKDGRKIELKVPPEMVREMVESRAYLFNKENKELLRGKKT